MDRRYIAPVMFVVGALLAALAAFEVVGFYGGMAGVLCIVVGVTTLTVKRT